MKKIIPLLFILASHSLTAQWNNNTNNYTTGSLGLGTSSPGGKLDINQAGAQLRLSGGTVAGGVWTNATDILYLADWNTGTKGLNINMTSGNIGIGITNSPAKLQISGSVYSSATRSNNVFSGWIGADNVNFIGSEGYWALRTATNNSFNLDVFNSSDEMTAMTVLQNGNVGIGTNSITHKLTVNGKILAEEVKVVVDVPADYVFNTDYSLSPLKEVEKYISTNKHLPGLPSAEELKENGWHLGEMSNKMLEKIEELTLYMIDLKKENEKLKEEVDQLKRFIKP